MKDKLYINTEVSSYFLWEYTGHINALDLWYCTEDMALFLESSGITTLGEFRRITGLDYKHPDYIHFVRNIAYRIYLFTDDDDHLKNWYSSEHLIANNEWAEAIVNISALYSQIRTGTLKMADSIRTDRIRRFFSS